MRDNRGRFVSGYLKPKEYRDKQAEKIRGKKHSMETKKRMSLSKIGNKLCLGYKQTLEHKKKISESSKGKHYYWKGRKFTEEHKNKLRGKICTEETRQKLRVISLRNGNKPPVKRGSSNFNWKGGITPINLKIRHSLEYKLWRKSVFERDNYTCIWCGARGGNGKSVILHADHIKPFCDFPELRLVIDNGRTLCIDCHKKTDTYKNKNGRNQYTKT